MEGWVEKSSDSGPWRQRFLVLHEDACELCTYPHAYLLSQSPPVPSERIALTDQTLIVTAASADRCDSNPKRYREFVFVVQSDGCDIRFSCGSVATRDRWVELISKAALARSRAQHAVLGRDEAPAPVEYIALVAGGLASLAADDIALRLGLPRAEVESVPEPPEADQWSPAALQLGQRSVFPGGAGVAKLRFSLPAPADEAAARAQIMTLRLLPMVQVLLAPVAISASISRESDGVAQVEDAAVRSPRWNEALRTWRHFSGRSDVFRPSFRCSCVRDGQHAFGSLDVAAAVGGGLHHSFGWSVDLRGFDVEVAILVLQSQLVMGITLSTGGLLRHNRLPPEARPLMPCCDVGARLRCSSAWAMVALAQPKVGDVLLDPMAGVGTIPLEAAARWGGLLALGGDADLEGVEQMAANATRFELAARRAAAEALTTLPLAGGGLPTWHAAERRYATPPGGGGVGVCSWDVLQLPLRTGSVDLCVVDMPFGMACKVKGGIKQFYPRAVLQMARVLRPEGRLVLLSPSRQLLMQVLQQQAHLWTDEQRLDVNCGGLLACLTVWRRTHTPAELPTAGSGGTLDEPPPDTLSPAAPGAADARDKPSLFKRIVQCEAPAADCSVM